MKRKSVCMLRPDSEKVGSGKERGILPLSIGMLSSGTTCGHTALLKLPPLSHSEADSGLLSWVNREVRPAGLQPAKQSAKGREVEMPPTEEGARPRVTVLGEPRKWVLSCPWLSVEDGAGGVTQMEV